MSKDETKPGPFGGRLWTGEKHKPAPPHPANEADAPGHPQELETPPGLVIPANRVYAPYETRSRPESLILFLAKLPSQMPTYHHLSNISFDPFYARTFSLFYPFMTVTVTGQRLTEIVHAINARKCAIAREWHRDLYDPPERGVAVIEKIDISTAMESP